METQGAYGYHDNDADKVTYNHLHSYPDVLGARTLSYVSRIGYEKMRNATSSSM
ncbi:MAG: hypothetical protein IIB00_06430 [candidate division Zixibacteria bacterium]|nr:hypothetical protein [candidate division Zixibacteria bacterium]